jgi:O-antigen ligase
VKSLALASFIFVVYHVLFTDFKEVMNPYYRLSVFINTNSVGFIAAICVVVHLMFFFNRRHFNFSLPLIVEALAIILGMFVVYITRSRTATIALIGGILSVFVFTSRIRYKRLLLVPTIIIITLLSSLVFGQKLFSIISSNYSFNDQYRDISHMTNRTDIWEYTVNTIIYPHPFLGFGPGKAEELIVNSAIGISIDNGFLKCLAEIGIIGIIPLILLLYHPLRIVIKDLTKAKLLFPILIAGIIESFAENMLFSTGNVGSLLFLLSIISGNE